MSFPNLSGAIKGVGAAFTSAGKEAGRFKTAFSGIGKLISAHPYIALAAGIAIVVSALNKASNAAIDASEKSKEVVQKAMEVTAGLDEEKSRVAELIEQYKELILILQTKQHFTQKQISVKCFP